MLRSGLPKEILKQIWIISAQTDPKTFDKEDFFIALRLIALAQQGVSVSEENILKNYPIPKLPQMDLTGLVNIPQVTNKKEVIQSACIWDIGKEEGKTITESYNREKDMEKCISLRKTIEMLSRIGIPKHILTGCINLVATGSQESFTFAEYGVLLKLIVTLQNHKDIAIPDKIPDNLIKILENDRRQQEELKQSYSNIILSNNASPIPNPHVENISEEATIIIKTIQYDPSQLASLTTELLKVSGGLRILYESMKDENSKLTKDLSEEQTTLKCIQESNSYVESSFDTANTLSKCIKKQILEIRRKINIEKDQLAKTASTLKYESSELMREGFIIKKKRAKLSMNKALLNRGKKALLK